MINNFVIVNTTVTNNWNYPTNSTVLNEFTYDHFPVLITAESLIEIHYPFFNKPYHNWTICKNKLEQLPATPHIYRYR